MIRKSGIILSLAGNGSKETSKSHQIDGKFILNIDCDQSYLMFDRDEVLP